MKNQLGNGNRALGDENNAKGYINGTLGEGNHALCDEKHALGRKSKDREPSARWLYNI